MGRFLIFALLYASFIIFELIPLFKRKKYKIFTAYILIMVVAFIIQVTTLLGFTAHSLGFQTSVIMDIFKNLYQIK